MTTLKKVVRKKLEHELKSRRMYKMCTSVIKFAQMEKRTEKKVTWANANMVSRLPKLEEFLITKLDINYSRQINSKIILSSWVEHERKNWMACQLSHKSKGERLQGVS